MQFFHRKPYHFFYPAGLISLVLLPLLGFLYLHSKGYFNEQFAIEVNFWNPEQHKANPELFKATPQSFRNYKTIILNGNKLDDKQKLETAQIEIHQMLVNRDTLNGVHLLYGPKSKYASMVAGLNICLKEEEKAGLPVVGYSSYKNNLWIFYVKPNNEMSFICGTNYIMNIIESENKYPPPIGIIIQKAEEIFFQFYSARHFWPAAILYLIMVTLAAHKVVRQVRIQQRTTSN